MYDESYQVADGDTVPTPKHSPQHQRISIKSAGVIKQKSASQIQDSFSHNDDGNHDKDSSKRPSTSVNLTSVRKNKRHDPPPLLAQHIIEATVGIRKPIETSRATFRVSSAKPMNPPAERPLTRNGSGKAHPPPTTPDEHGGGSDDDEEDDDDDDDEYENGARDNEESFKNIESVMKREFADISQYTSSDDEDDDDSFLEDENEPIISTNKSHNNRSTSNYLMRTNPSTLTNNNLIPEDLFDAMNESTDEDEDESLRKFFTRQHLHELQLDREREEIRKRVIAGHYKTGPGVHRHGCWMYNPTDYDNLPVSSEIKDIFQYITKYVPSPANSQVEVKLKPFIPEYYPSVGDIDAFIKVVHPEIKNDSLGIKCLDEPSAFQSDPSVLDLRLRALAKQSSAKAIVVKKVENVTKNTKIIENWINDISDLHRSKPSPSVHYSKPMPDIDTLIQEWPPEVEDLLKNLSFPTPDLDCNLATYVDIVCNLLDIPVYTSKRIQSLHALCTLYATHRNFNQYGALGNSQSQGMNDNLILLPSTAMKLDTDSVDRLEL